MGLIKYQSGFNFGQQSFNQLSTHSFEEKRPIWTFEGIDFHLQKYDTSTRGPDETDYKEALCWHIRGNDVNPRIDVT
jgi:hypothetical protein